LSQLGDHDSEACPEYKSIGDIGRFRVTFIPYDLFPVLRMKEEKDIPDQIPLLEEESRYNSSFPDVITRVREDDSYSIILPYILLLL
jgi:hypothetical protein